MVEEWHITKGFSILGSRYIGMGSHEAKIDIPNTLVGDLQKLAIDRLEKLETELKESLT